MFFFTVLQRKLCHWSDVILIRTMSARGCVFKRTHARTHASNFLTFISPGHERKRAHVLEIRFKHSSERKLVNELFIFFFKWNVMNVLY